MVDGVRGVSKFQFVPGPLLVKDSMQTTCMAAAACVVLMAMAANAESCDDLDHRCPHTVFEVESCSTTGSMIHAFTSLLAMLTRSLVITRRAVHMKDKTFSSLLQACGSAAWFVLLYSPGCRGCKDFLQAWDRLAEQVTVQGEMR